MSNPIPEQFVPLSQLMGAGRPLLNVRNIPAGSEQTSFAVGFHLYININLTMPLAAAEDPTTNQKYLRILAAYADIAAGAAQVTGSHLLEVQGERLHFLVENERNLNLPDAASWQRLLALAQAVVTLAYEKIAPMAREHWRGCAAAADYGPAALLHSEWGGGSLVSLGNAANRPAKRLGQVPAVTAGHLAVPSTLAPRELGGNLVGSWREIDVHTPKSASGEFDSSDVGNSLRRFFDERTVARSALTLNQADQAFFNSLGKGGQVSPVQVQGFCFRADLDGFTKQVQEAFAKGDAAVIALVRRFRSILDFPRAFVATLNARVIPLPWAGDCANLLILPADGESFSQARTYLPIRSAVAWHQAFGAERRYTESVGESKWSLGLAAGDDEEGYSGRMLVADLAAGDRSFRVAGGWPVRRSSDAYQYDGVVGGDTVVTKVDRKHFFSAHAQKFRDLGTDFACAKIDELQRSASEQASRAALSAARPSSVRSHPLPAPIPHHDSR